MKKSLKHCAVCKGKFFTYREEQKCCSQGCNQIVRSLAEFKAVKRIPYRGNVNWAYVAGFFDGEGSIGVSAAVNNSRTIKVGMSQKDRTVLDDISNFLCSEGIYAGIYFDGRNHKLHFANRYAVYKFIMKIQNFSVVKFDSICDASYFLWTMIKKA